LHDKNEVQTIKDPKPHLYEQRMIVFNNEGREKLERECVTPLSIKTLLR